MNASRTALVLGAHGVIGSTLLDHLASLPDFDVVGVSRRGGPDTDQVRHVAVDLLDADATRTAMARLPEVTHVFYAAFQDRPTWAELVAPNLAMLTHTVEAVAEAAAGLRHVSLMQGYKRCTAPTWAGSRPRRARTTRGTSRRSSTSTSSAT